MTMYLALLEGGSQVDAVRIDGHFESLNGVVIEPISLVSFDAITRGQYEFESLYRQFTLKGDFSKYDSLIYQDSRMVAAYSVWRIARGLPVTDPDYKSLGKVAVSIPASLIYSNAKHKGD